MEKLKRKLRYYFFVFLFLFLFLFAYMIGMKSTGEYSESSKIIYLENEPQVYRNKNGKRMKVIEKDNVTYIPISEVGTFLNYTVTENLDSITLSKFEKEEDSLIIDTKTLNGERFTNEDLYSYDYTIFLNWTTWCPDCKDFLKNYSILCEKLEDLNIQFVGIPIYNKIEKSSEEENQEIQKIFNEYNIEFKNILVNKYLENNLQSNLLNIPSIVIVDKKGKIKDIDDTVDLNIDSILKKIEDLPICGEC